MKSLHYIVIGSIGALCGIYIAPYISDNKDIGKLMTGSIIDYETHNKEVIEDTKQAIKSTVEEDWYRGGVDNKGDIDMQIHTKQVDNTTLEVSLDMINSGMKSIKTPYIEVQIPSSYSYKTASTVFSGTPQTDNEDTDYTAVYDNTIVFMLPKLEPQTTKTAVFTMVQKKNKHYGMTTNGHFIDMEYPDKPLYTAINKTIYASTIDDTGENIYYIDDTNSTLYSVNITTNAAVEYPFTAFDNALISGMTFINDDEIALLDAHNSSLYTYSLSAKKLINTVSMKHKDGTNVLPQGGDIAVLDDDTYLLLTNSSDNNTSVLYRIDATSGLTELYMAVLPEGKYDGVEAYNDGTIVLNNADGMYIKSSNDTSFSTAMDSIKIGYEVDNTAVVDDTVMFDIAFTDAYKWRFEKTISLDNDSYEYHFDNTPPAFTTLPKTTLSYNIPHKQLITGTDKENDTLSLALLKAPSWVSLDGMEMLITPLEIGTFDVIIALSDSRGGIVKHAYTLIIEPSIAPTDHIITGEYTYKNMIDKQNYHIILHADGTTTWYDGTLYVWEYKGKELVLTAPDKPSLHYTMTQDDVFEGQDSLLLKL